METMTLKGRTWRTDGCSTGTLPLDLPYDSHLQEKDKSLKTKDPGRMPSPSGEQPEPFPFPSSSPTSFPTSMNLLNAKAVGSWQLVPG